VGQAQHEANDLLNVAGNVVVNPQDVCRFTFLKRQFESAAQGFIKLAILQAQLGE
jgi:hypothetical protein